MAMRGKHSIGAAPSAGIVATSATMPNQIASASRPAADRTRGARGGGRAYFEYCFTSATASSYIFLPSMPLAETSLIHSSSTWAVASFHFASSSAVI